MGKTCIEEGGGITTFTVVGTVMADGKLKFSIYDLSPVQFKMYQNCPNWSNTVQSPPRNNPFSMQDFIYIDNFEGATKNTSMSFTKGSANWEVILRNTSSGGGTSTSGSLLSQAERDKICRDVWGSDSSYDPVKDECTIPNSNSSSLTLSELDKLCKDTWGSDAFHDPKTDECNANISKDRICKEKLGGNYYYDQNRGKCWKASLTQAELDKKCKENYGSNRFYDPVTNQCSRTLEDFAKYCKEEFSEYHNYDAENNLCVQDKDAYCKGEYGSDVFYDVTKEECIRPQSTTSKIDVPLPTPKIKKTAEPFFDSLFDGVCPSLHNSAELLAGLSEFPLVCTDGTFVLPSNNIASIKLADDWDVKIGEWGSEGLLKTMATKNHNVAMLLEVKELYDAVKAGPFGLRGTLEELKTLTMWVESGEGTILNGIIEVKVSCPTGECDFHHLEKKGDSFVWEKIDSFLDETNYLNVKLNHNSVYLVTVYSVEKSPLEEKIISEGKILYKQLTWSDYKGETEPLNPAQTSTGIEYHLKWEKIDSSDCVVKFTDVNSISYFDPIRSFVNSPSENRLKHEQGEFDIDEIFARAFEKEMHDKTFACPGGIYDHEKITDLHHQIYYNMMDEKREIKQLYYDKTFYGDNNKKQADWNLKIECMLDNNGPSDYCLELVSEQATGGGCLIATATYGSELAPQVQQLRELRDNQLLQTESGTSFMKHFNDFYYSFSPIVADYERENPVFKEIVKVAITPMISSLSILNYVDMDSESSVLGYGISLILLNVGMYVGIPVGAIVVIRRY